MPTHLAERAEGAETSQHQVEVEVHEVGEAALIRYPLKQPSLMARRGPLSSGSVSPAAAPVPSSSLPLAPGSGQGPFVPSRGRHMASGTHPYGYLP